MEQESKTMKEFVQEFRRVAMVEEFKREMNGIIKGKLIEAEA